MATEYFDALDLRLRELGPPTIDMLTTEAAEPSQVLDLVQAAALALRVPPGVLSPESMDIARSLVAKTRNKRGARVLNEAFDLMDLEVLSGLSEDTEASQTRLRELFERGLLVDVLTPSRRHALSEALADTAARLLTADTPKHLYDTAFFLSHLVDLPEEHPVAELLDATLGASDWIAQLEPGPSAAELDALFDGARARVEAERSPIDKLVNWASAQLGGLAQLLRPTEVAFAASRAPVSWPRPRLLLGRHDAVEVAIVTLEGRPTLEIIEHGVGVPEFTTSGDIEDGSLVVQVGTWRCDMRQLELVRAPYPFTKPLNTLAERSPHALRAELLRQAATTPSLSLRRAFEAEATRMDTPSVPPQTGQAWAIVVSSDGTPGFLARITNAAFGAGLPPALVGIEDERVRAVGRWVGALVGAPELELDLRFVTHGAALDGDSWQLAAALAVLSERLGAPRALVASGALGDTIGLVLPVERIADKRVVASHEAEGADVLLIDAPRDLRPELARLFGDDWQARLRIALGVAPDALARQAMRQWRAFWGRRNTSAAGPMVSDALAQAEAALAAGVTGVHAIEARWVAGACRLHRGETTLAEAAFAELEGALAVLPAGQLPALLSEELLAYRGIALVDQARPSEATALLRPVLAALDALTHRDRRFFEVRVQVAGTLQRATAFNGDLDEARRLLIESLEHGLPEERARTLGDLAELERRGGDVDAAHDRLNEARTALDDIDTPAIAAFTERFLRVFEVRSGLALSDIEPRPIEWNAWPQPLEVVEAAAALGLLPSMVEYEEILAAPLIQRVWILGALYRTGAAPELVAPLVESLRDKIEPTLAVHLDDPSEWTRRCPY